MSWRSFILVIAVVSLLAPTLCGTGAGFCPMRAMSPAATDCSMAGTPAPSSGDCCSTRAPGVRPSAATAWVGSPAPQALGLAPGVSIPRLDPLSPGNPSPPDRSGSIRSAPLYTLHSALLI